MAKQPTQQIESFENSHKAYQTAKQKISQLELTP